MKNEIYFPREDSFFLTQIIEKQVPKLLSKNLNLTFLEIGSGSGIQLKAALKSRVKKQNIFSCDINSLSVRRCKSLGFNCIHSDLLENIKGKYNVIVFNPPYLPEEFLEPESSKVSTTGGKEGSEIINKFLKQAKSHLNKNGKILLLTSSHTKDVDFLDYAKKIVAKRKLFFEELYVWELKITTK